MQIHIYLANHHPWIIITEWMTTRQYPLDRAHFTTHTESDLMETPVALVMNILSHFSTLRIQPSSVFGTLIGPLTKLYETDPGFMIRFI